MLHHISFSVSDLQKSKLFYESLLKPLGYRVVCEGQNFVGFGIEDNKDKFALKKRGESVNPPSPGFHLAFAAPSTLAVDEAYDKALTQGGKDNGPPGLRSHYGPHYYAAFLIDPDGYPVEILINTPMA